MASKRPRPIHHQMKRCEYVEENALRLAGVPDRDYADLTSPVQWDNDEYPIGPCKANLDVLREKYGEE